MIMPNDNYVILIILTAPALHLVQDTPPPPSILGRAVLFLSERLLPEPNAAPLLLFAVVQLQACGDFVESAARSFRRANIRKRATLSLQSCKYWSGREAAVRVETHRGPCPKTV